MKEKTILISAYGCSPYDISDANNAFYWLIGILENYNVFLFTTSDNENDICKYFATNYPNNLKIVSFKDKYPFKSNKYISKSLKLGYLIFNYKLRNFLFNNKSYIDNSDLLFHKTPTAIRYYTCLCEFNRPLIIGPYGGGLKPPVDLIDYFAKEHFLLKLRKFDKLLLKGNNIQRQFKKASKILITLPYLKDILPKDYSDKYIQLFDSGIDTSKFKKNHITKNEKIRFLFVGRLTRYKGVELILDSINILEDCLRSKIQIDIVGSGEESDYLITKCKSLSIDDTVKFHGAKNKAEVMEFYNNSDIFLFPTLKESMGIVLLEAMSFSLPIITIDYGGPKYICPSEGNIKIPISTSKDIVNDIANSIERFVNDRNLILEMGNFNRTYCVDNYDWSKIYNNINVFLKDFFEQDKNSY